MLRRTFSALAKGSGISTKYPTIITRGHITVSQLPSGLKVMSYDDGSAVTAMGFFALNGPLYETGKHVGSAAVLESLILHDNAIIKQPQLSQDLGVLGNAIKVGNHREAIGHIILGPKYHANDILELMNAIALHPTEDPNEFMLAKEEAKARVSLGHGDFSNQCLEYMHQAGWNGKGVGRPLLPEAEQVEQLTHQNFLDFHAAATRPERSCLVASGVTDHEKFCERVEKHLRFREMPKAKVELGAVTPYTGGTLLVKEDKAMEDVRKFGDTPKTHIAICYGTKSVAAERDYFTCSLMQTLMGGGLAFSSGGPGKGVQSKLFREVIHRESWIFAIESITAWYTGNGLIGILAQADQEWSHKLLDVCMYQLTSMSQRINEHNVEVAKKGLLSQLILLGDSREVQIEEHGKMLLLHNAVHTTEDLIAGTKQIRLKDVVETCKGLANGPPPTLAVYGQTSRMPAHEQFTKKMAALHRKLN